MEKQEKQQEQEQVEQTEQAKSDESWREKAAKAGIFDQLKKAQRELDSMKEAQQKAKEDAERKALEDAGKYTEVKAKLESELAETKKRHETEVRNLKLESELVRAGLSNSLALRGAIAAYDGAVDGIADYVAALKKDHADLFGKPVLQGSGSPAQGAPSATTEKDDAVALKKIAAQSGPAGADARGKLLKLFVETGDEKYLVGY